MTKKQQKFSNLTMKKGKGLSAKVKERIWSLHQIHGDKWTAILDDLVEEQKKGKISARLRLPADARTIKAYILERIRKSGASTPVIEHGDRSISHDTAVFCQSDEIVNEADLNGIIYRLRSDLSIEDDGQIQLMKYYEFFRYSNEKPKISRMYTDSEILSRLNKLLDSMGELIDYRYFDYANSRLRILWPYDKDMPTDAEFQNIQELNEKTIEQIKHGSQFIVRSGLAYWHPRFEKYRKELLDIAESVVNDYEAYRTAVHEKLYM